MLRFLKLYFGTLVRLLRSRQSLLLENLALRQQLVVLKRRHPRPSLGTFDRLFWIVAQRVWDGWKRSLIIVTPETVIRWHRAGFRLYLLGVDFQDQEAGWEKTDVKGNMARERTVKSTGLRDFS